MHTSNTSPISASRQDASKLERADLVIIGNGIAGLTAAVETCRLAPTTSVVVVSDQQYPTINTPALKQYAAGKLEPEQLLAFPQGIERGLGIHVVHGHVERIESQNQLIGISGGRSLGYKSLVVATGSRPNGLAPQTPNGQMDGVLTLHRLEDYRDLRRRLPLVQQAVVIGGGVHAVETVMALRSWQIQTHWLVRSGHFMPKLLDQSASNLILDHMRALGVQIHTQTEVVGVIGRLGTVAGVLTNHQELLPCQLVVCCTGTRANTALADACTEPLLHKNGILVNEKLQTSIQNIYAAGDVAALENPQTGKYEPRPQWYAAVQQARMIAAVLTGREDKVPPFGAYWHATHVGKLSLLTVGDPLGGNETGLVEESRGTSYRRIAIANDRLVGYLSLDRTPSDGLAIKRIIDEGISIREIKDELLRPDFDARAYLAQRKSYYASVLASTTTTQMRIPVVPNTLLSRGPIGAFA
jgi:NAD(P)H-nitrite reductase large subunit